MRLLRELEKNDHDSPYNMSSADFAQTLTNSFLSTFLNSTIYEHALRKPYPSFLMPLSRISRDTWRLLTGSPYWNVVRKVILFVGIEFPPEDQKQHWEDEDCKCNFSFVQVPYPTMLHDASLDGSIRRDAAILNSKRKNQILFVGTCKEKEGVRKKICSDIDHSQRNMANTIQMRRTSFNPKDPTNMFWDMAVSKFYLQSPGDSPTRRGFYDSVLLGCVPVASDERAHRLFGGTIEAKDVALVVDMGGKTNVVESLEKIDEKRFQRLRERGIAVRAKLRYSTSHDEEHDAFGALLWTLRTLKVQPELQKTLC